MMTPEKFAETVARLVAGLQAPVSLMSAPQMMLGAGFEPWQDLLTEVNHGFGWTGSENCEQAFRQLLGLDEKKPEE